MAPPMGNANDMNVHETAMDATASEPGCTDSCCGNGDASSPRSDADSCCGDDGECAKAGASKQTPAQYSYEKAEKPACQDGCCKPKEEQKSSKTESKGCCSGTERIEASETKAGEFGDRCYKPRNALEDDCCSGGECTGAGASSNPHQAQEPDCNDGYCGPKEEDKTKCGKGESKGCCESDPSHGASAGNGCCDDSCLEKIAMRECEEQCGELRNRKSANKAGKKPMASASVRETRSSSSTRNNSSCDYHTQTTRQRYGAQLEAVGCICKALLARNLESCCSTAKCSSSIHGTPKSHAKGHDSSIRRRSMSPPTRAVHASRHHKHREDHSHVEKRTERIWSKIQRLLMFPNGGNHHNDDCEHDGCGSSGEATARDSCCSGSSPMKGVELETRDVERGPGTYERVAISVQGMTCSGCERKLGQTLRGIHAVSNVKTSLVLAKAEFDLNTTDMSFDEMLAELKYATTYSYERIMDQEGQSMDLLVNNSDEFYSQKLPGGVTRMDVLDKRTVRIHYDANTVGARNLLRHGFKDPVELAPLRPDPSVAAGRRQVLKEGLLFLTAAILTVPVLVFSWAPIRGPEIVYQSISLGLATFVQIGVVWQFYPSALKSLFRSRLVEMELLIVLSTTAAYSFSVVAFAYFVTGNPLSTGEFFETSTLLVTLILFGRFISELARQKATESISVRSLQSNKVLLLNEDRTGTEEIDVRLLQYGDAFRVPPDSRIVTDGDVVYGGSEVDESMVTGESRLVAKGVDSKVIAGSVNGSGTLDVAVSKLPFENTISTIAAMVDEAELEKPKSQAIADRIAGYFVPIIVVITIIVFIIQILIGIYAHSQESEDAVVQALTFAIATLIVSCPCAIGLAVPMVVVIAGGVAAKHGLVLKSPSMIEVARKTNHVLFDKTGTLTEGTLSVTREIILPEVGFAGDTRQILLGLVSNIKHPVSAAVATYLESQSFNPADVKDVAALPGKGVEGQYSSQFLQAGNSRWLEVEDDSRVKHLLEFGNTVFCLKIDGILAAVYGLEDSLRQEAPTIVAALQKRRIEVHIVSGDDDGAVRGVASRLNVPQRNVRSRCSPADKLTYLKELLAEPEADTCGTNGRSSVQANGLLAWLKPAPAKKPKNSPYTSRTAPTVLFCGDGTNDAVALTAASVGVHMGGGATGTDVAQSAADVVLVRPDLAGVPLLLDLSRAAFRRIQFNFAWAAVYNVAAILFAAGAFVRARIPPEYAGLGEIASVLPVIAIAFHLKLKRFGRVGE
ncbi:E1-E2 ATPase-domain-containing protein [Lineolata rhizophorae]|uniref:E1-E2 ATPase-domain-containing protein n=1 Tax=Lineolata rhizophorae TaxID=578093 RepID=A0A6A6NMD2_9PEZI|nr:E1-E2 ATPase-domain-containing protein [Lineolata rhizophorae]